MYILFLLLTVNSVFGQNKSNCLKELYAYFDRIEGIAKPASNQIYTLSYRQETESYQGPQLMENRVDVSVRMSDGKMILKSGRFSIFADTKDMFYIYHDQKMIQWVNGYDTLLQSRNPLNFLNQQKSVLENCSVTNCDEVVKDNRKLKEIYLEGNQSLKEETKVDNLIISYDLQENRIYKVIIEYVSKHSIQKQTTTYKELNFNIKGKLMESAYSMIFNNKGVLLKQFKDYSLIDNKH
jgi:hypothetical protein